MSSVLDDNFFASFGGNKVAPTTQAPAPADASSASAPVTTPAAAPQQSSLPNQAAPAPQQAAPAQAQPAPAAPKNSVLNDDFFKNFGSSPAPAPTSITSGNGANAYTPINDSPLSIAQRAMLGWARTPAEQEKMLKGEFDDVQMINNRFVVKQGGKWMEADPHFEWSTQGAKNLAGSAAQWTGEYGLRATAAAAASALAVAAAPVTLGVLGMTAAGAAAGGLGAMGAEALDLGSRKALNSNPNAAGANPYKTVGEVSQQLNASAIFGMENYVAGKAGEGALSTAAETMGGIINRVTNTPQGRQVVATFLKGMGFNDAVATARMANPLQNATFDRIAAADAGKSITEQKLPVVEDGLFTRVLNQIDGIKQRIGNQFATLKAMPEVRNAVIDSSESVGDAVKLLHQEGYIKPRMTMDSSGKVLSSEFEINPTRSYGDGDQQAIQKILDVAKKNPSKLSYDGARQLTQDLNTLMNQGTGSDTVFGALAKLKTAVHSDIVDGIGDAGGQKYGDLLNKYATSKDLFNTLDKLTETGQKKATFINRLMGDNQSNAKDLVRGLVDAGVDEGDINQLLQIQGSKQAQHLFKGSGFGRYIPASPRAGAALVSAGANVKSLVGDALSPVGDAMHDSYKMALPYLQKTASSLKDQAAALPYAEKVMSGLRTIDASTRQTLLQNPQAVQMMTQLISGGVTGEQETTKNLMQSVGLPPNGGGQ